MTPATSTPAARIRASPCACAGPGEAAASSTATTFHPASFKPMADCATQTSVSSPHSTAVRRPYRSNAATIGGHAASPNAGFVCRDAPVGKAASIGAAVDAVALGLLLGHQDGDVQERGEAHQPADPVDDGVGVRGPELAQEPGLGVDHDQHAVGVVREGSHIGRIAPALRGLARVAANTYG